MAPDERDPQVYPARPNIATNGARDAGRSGRPPTPLLYNGTALATRGAVLFIAAVTRIGSELYISKARPTRRRSLAGEDSGLEGGGKCGTRAPAGPGYNA